MSHLDDSNLMDLSQTEQTSTPSPIRAPPPPPPPPPVGAPPPQKGNRRRKRKQNGGERPKMITVS